jgi:hypothetical protein
LQLFLFGGLVTAVFSGSLFMLTRDISFTEVMLVGMIAPCFTWVVQSTAAALLLSPEKRTVYWHDLGWICVLGSFALLPAAVVNLSLSEPRLWISAGNVLASVAIMAVDLFRRSAAHGIAWGWPVSWCLTISLNMAIFAWTSRHRWGS